MPLVGGLTTLGKCGQCGRRFETAPEEIRSAERQRRKLMCRRCTPTSRERRRFDPVAEVRDMLRRPAEGDRSSLRRLRCDGCGQIKPMNEMTEVGEDEHLCENCLDRGEYPPVPQDAPRSWAGTAEYRSAEELAFDDHCRRRYLGHGSRTRTWDPTLGENWVVVH